MSAVLQEIPDLQAGKGTRYERRGISEKEEEEMLLSSCKTEEEQELMKSCIYAYQYSAAIVLKSFREKEKEK